jgi:hypothetical protein
MSQNDRLLHLLREVGDAGLTPLAALHEVGTLRLAARIYELRREGYDIEAREQRVSGGRRVASYVLREAAQLGLAL